MAPRSEGDLRGGRPANRHCERVEAAKCEDVHIVSLCCLSKGCHEGYVASAEARARKGGRRVCEPLRSRYLGAMGAAPPRVFRSSRTPATAGHELYAGSTLSSAPQYHRPMNRLRHTFRLRTSRVTCSQRLTDIRTVSSSRGHLSEQR